METYGENAVYISVMADANTAPSQSVVANWASSYNIVHPVLADPNGETMPYVTLGYPTYVVIKQDMTIYNADLWPFNAAEIGGLIQ